MGTKENTGKALSIVFDSQVVAALIINTNKHCVGNDFNSSVL